MVNLFIYVVVVPMIIISFGLMIARRYKLRSNPLILIAAACLFSLSLFLPSPLIDGNDTQFLTHFFGGGIFVGLLSLYFKSLLKRRLTWYQEGIGLYVLVSAFGVLNELYELFAHQVGLFSQSLNDTSWDLFANTLGALVFFVVYRAVILVKRLFISR